MRRRGYYPDQQHVPPGMVDFGQFTPSHETIIPMYSEIGDRSQQRWDLQDAAIAKFMEEQGSTQMLAQDVPGVGQAIEKSFGNIDEAVKKYQGDRGAAAGEIIKQLGAARGPLAQAKAEKERYDQAFTEYQRAAQAGQAPQAFGAVDEFGRKAPRTLSFEEYHSLKDQKNFGEEGYTPRQYNTLRGASNLSEYTNQFVSRALNAESTDSFLQGSNVLGFLMQQSIDGATNTELQDAFFDKNTGQLTSRGTELAQQLRGEVDFLQDELGANTTDAELMQYALPIIQNQVASQIRLKYQQDPLSIDRMRQQGNDRNVIAGIFGGAGSERNDLNPLVEERGSYAEAISPSFWSNAKDVLLGQSFPINIPEESYNDFRNYIIIPKL